MTEKQEDYNSFMFILWFCITAISLIVIIFQLVSISYFNINVLRISMITFLIGVLTCVALGFSIQD